MSAEKSVREMVAEWNAKAKAKGEFVEQDPWSLPVLYEGSIVDVPKTSDARERIRRLDMLIARLERENGGATPKEQHDVCDEKIAVSTVPNAEVPANTPNIGETS